MKSKNFIKLTTTLAEMEDDAPASIIVSQFSSDRASPSQKLKNTKLKMGNSKQNSRFNDFYKYNGKRQGSSKRAEITSCEILHDAKRRKNGGISNGATNESREENSIDGAGNESMEINSGSNVTNTGAIRKNYANNNNHTTNRVVEEKMAEQNQVNYHQSQPVSGNGNKERSKNENDPLLYSKDHVGDVIVLVDTSKAELINNKKIKNGLYFYEKIRDLNCTGIKNIKAVGITLYKIFFDNVISANKFVLNKKIHEKNIRPFIPKNFIETYGVIRDVPLYLSDEDILHNVSSSMKVTYVKRFMKRTGRGSNEVTPTYSVKIGFAGNDVPEQVILNYTILKVDLFYPAVRQCFNCGRLGHTKNGCRSKQRCITCGKDGECKEACGAVKCILCGQPDHKASDKNKCEKWNKENEINKIMTVKKMSKSEVMRTYSQPSQNKYDILSDNESFPDLLSGGNNTRNGDREVNRILTPRRYSSVLKQVPRPPIMKPHFERPQRMYKEVENKSPVYERQMYSKVSELEKLTTEILKFMKDHFANMSNQIGLEAVGHFSDRVKKIGIDMDHQIITQTNPFSQDEDFTI